MYSSHDMTSMCITVELEFSVWRARPWANLGAHGIRHVLYHPEKAGAC